LAKWPPHGSQGFGSQAGLQHFGFGQQCSIRIFGKQISGILKQHFGLQHFGAQGFGAQHFGAQGFGSQHFGFSQQPWPSFGNLMHFSMPTSLCPAHGSHGAGHGFGASQHELQRCRLNLLSSP
jgi:hypothetical protein